MEGPVARIGTLVGLQDDHIHFDAIVGRNVFADIEQRDSVIATIAGLLATGGTISFAETVPRLSQRLTDLVKLDSLGQDLAARILQAEEAIYADAGNPRVTWDPQDLAAMWSAGGLVEVEVETETLQAQRRLSSQHLGSWFNPGGEKHRTFASFLRRFLDTAEVSAVRHHFEDLLLNRDVQWSTTYAYVRGRAPSGG